MIRWGVLSTAAIAADVVSAARDTERAGFVAVVSPARARRWADEHGLPATGRPVGR